MANVHLSQVPPEPTEERRVEQREMSAYSDAQPASPVRLLFIHHSVGGTLLADHGPALEDDASIFRSHPNGGGLRSRLERQGYEVHQASYGSRVGDKTDLFDWLPKFRNHMDRIRTIDRNDALYADGRRNQVVVFKSCFPNSSFVGEGQEPGNPDGPELTVTNAKATMTALLGELEKHPDVLFVYMTAPPLAPQVFQERAWKLAVKRIIGKASWAEEYAAQARVARRFNDWIRGADGWLEDYRLNNVVVFDYYDVLTGHGASDLSRFPTEIEGVLDSHPSSAGNANAAAAFVPLLNRAVRRAGLSK